MEVQRTNTAIIPPNTTMATLAPKVQKTSFTFKSDVRKSNESHPSGVLHALRSSPDGREEHSFAWVVNYDTSEAALGHLERYGFTRDKVQFIPFSSKSAWVTKYPHAFPYVDCDEHGNVTGFPQWSPHAQSALDIPPEVVHVTTQSSTTAAIARSAAVKGKASGLISHKKKSALANRLGNTLLTNQERHQLHQEIYNYFSWLNEQVTELETSEPGRRSVKKANLKVTGLRSLLVKMEGTLNVEKKASKDDSMDTEGGEDGDNNVGSSVPLLEESLINEMSNMAAVEEEAQKKRKAKVKAESAANKKKYAWEPLDFDTMFEKLLAYKQSIGHPNVPVKYPEDVQLGSWVSGLRTKKKAYDKDGGGAAMDEEAWADGDNNNQEASNVTPSINQKYLTPDRILRLEEIGFAWTMANPKSKPKAWSERIEELRQWHEENGTFKVPRAESLGEWLHNQRTLYAKRDKKFMENKAPRMEAIGYKFDLRENTSVSWDDRFQQLCEFHRVNGHFEVGPPVSEEDDTGGDAGNSEATEESFRFFKWVQRLHNEYRAYEKGTHSKLNDERVAKLKGINFLFKGPKSRGRPSTNSISIVPKLSWEKRMQQVEQFKQDTGHLEIDHNYRHCSNLGGWAADISALYKGWKDGTQQLPQDTIEKFNILEQMGFQFNVLSYYESNRSWEDHYAVLLRYKEHNNGSARVPLKYKADLRLGKWVQTQRQQYKLISEGKKSKLNNERLQLLQNAAFEWDVGAGGGEMTMDEEV